MQASALSTIFPSKECSGCTESQRETAAIAQPGPNGRHVYVHDLASGVLYKYEVESEPVPGGYVYYAFSETPEPQYQAVVTELKGYYDAAGHHLVYKATAQHPPASSAFDVVDPGPGRTNTLNWVRNQNNWPLADVVLYHYQLLTGAAYAIRTGQPIKIVFEVVFPDGSVCDVEYTYPDQQVTYVDKSAYDSRGNPIPQSRTDIVRTPNGRQTYDFTNSGGPDLNRAIQRFVDFGIPVQQGFYWACTSDPATGTHCVHQF
jgi:hypothetical protein